MPHPLPSPRACTLGCVCIYTNPSFPQRRLLTCQRTRICLVFAAPAPSCEGSQWLNLQVPSSGCPPAQPSITCSFVHHALLHPSGPAGLPRPVSSCPGPTVVPVTEYSAVAAARGVAYRNSMDCTVTFEVLSPPGAVLSLRFTYFETEVGRDFLWVQDGDSVDYWLLGPRLSGELPAGLQLNTSTSAYARALASSPNARVRVGIARYKRMCIHTARCRLHGVRGNCSQMRV